MKINKPKLYIKTLKLMTAIFIVWLPGAILITVEPFYVSKVSVVVTQLCWYNMGRVFFLKTHLSFSN